MSIWIVVFRRSIRRLAAQPGFTIAASGLLALGLAATTGFLVLVRTVLFAPLPYEDPTALYGLRSRNDHDGLASDTLSVADFADLRRDQSSFSAMAAFRGDFINYSPDAGSTQQWFGARVTSGFFDVLGVPALRGRLLMPDDFRAGAPQVAVISEQTWHQKWNRDESVVGTTLNLNGQPVTLVGIMQREGREPVFADTWLPFPDRSPEYFLRDARYWNAIARLDRKTSLNTAQAETKTIAANLAEAYPKTNRHWTLELVPLLEMRVSGARQTLLLGSITATLLLLVTGLNLANLLLARGTRRQTEYALQRAIGANSRHLAGAALIEVGLLTGLGGLLAAMILAIGFNIVLPGLSTEVLPRADEIVFEIQDIALLLAVTAVTGLLSGLWPAFQALRPNLLRLLNQVGGRHSQDPATKRLRGGLLVLQIAVTLTIVSAAGVVAQQLRKLLDIPMGYNPEHIEAFLISPDQRRFQEFSDLRGYYSRMLERLRRDPAIEAAELTTFPPLMGASLEFSFDIENYTDPDERTIEAGIQFVTPGFFSLLEIPLTEGRTFSGEDTPSAPMTVVINRALADKYFEGRNPVGRRIRVLPWMHPDWRRVVGVVGTSKRDSLTEDPQPQLFICSEQSPWLFGHLLIRARNPASPIAAKVESMVQEIDPELAVSGYSLDTLRDRQTARARTLTTLMIGFASAAVALAAFGVYALVTLSVTDQTREIGIRMALGADRKMIVTHYIRFGLRTVILGAIGGIILSVFADRLLRPLIGESGTANLGLLALSVLTLGLIGVLASLVPSFRAARLSPSSALRVS